MKKSLKILQSTFAIVSNWLFTLLGGYDELLSTLILLVILDYITIVIEAIIDRSFSVKKGFQTLYCKILIFFLVAIAHNLDIYIVENNCILRNVVICFYVYHEGISILKNIENLGVPTPNKLRNTLKHLFENEQSEDS